MTTHVKEGWRVGHPQWLDNVWETLSFEIAARCEGGWERGGSRKVCYNSGAGEQAPHIGPVADEQFSTSGINSIKMALPEFGTRRRRKNHYWGSAYVQQPLALGLMAWAWFQHSVPFSLTVSSMARYTRAPSIVPYSSFHSQ